MTYKDRLAEVVANALTLQTGRPTTVRVEDGFAYVDAQGADHVARYRVPPEVLDDVARFEEYGGDPVVVVFPPA